MPPSRVASRFLVAELVDRAGEALGHLALAVQLQCPLRDVRGTVRDEGATQSDGASEGGENGGTNAAQFFGPVLPGQVPVVEPLGGSPTARRAMRMMAASHQIPETRVRGATARAYSTGREGCAPLVDNRLFDGGRKVRVCGRTSFRREADLRSLAVRASVSRPDTAQTRSPRACARDDACEVRDDDAPRELAARHNEP